MTQFDSERELSREERDALRERLQIESQADYLVKQKIDLKDVKVLSREETAALRKEWERIYIPPHEKKVPLHRCSFCRQGNRARIYASSFNWHTFSFGLFPSVTIDDSDVLDERASFLSSLAISEQALVLIWEPCGYPALEIPTDIVREFAFDTDLYLFPRSLEWTFVSTHETWSFYAQKSGSEKSR